MDADITQSKTAEQKTYAIGTISIAGDGTWHCHFVGPHVEGGKAYFGNGHLGGRNLRKLLSVVSTRIGKSQAVYQGKIREVEEAAAPTTEGVNHGDSVTEAKEGEPQFSSDGL